MGAAASINTEALNALKEASADVSDVADPKAEVVRLRKLIAGSGAGGFAQFKDEAGRPVDGSDISDDGQAELGRLRAYLAGVFSPENYKKVEEAITSAVPTQDVAAAVPVVEEVAADLVEEPVPSVPSVEVIKLPELLDKWEECIKVHKKWPLFLDSNESKPVASFLGYQTLLTIDAKKGMVESSIKKTKSIDDVREEWRALVTKCMIKKTNPQNAYELKGCPLWLHLGNSATDFKGKFCADDFPEDFFSFTKMCDEETKKKFCKDDDFNGTMEGMVWGEEFKVIITSDFEVEDYVEFLENSIPLEHLKVYNVVMDS
jgi:hypothetical protein|eukprot:Stramenopile-MAST_4_protein_1681